MATPTEVRVKVSNGGTVVVGPYLIMRIEQLTCCLPTVDAAKFVRVPACMHGTAVPSLLLRLLPIGLQIVLVYLRVLESRKYTSSF